jgi:hypothetical protein
VTGGPEMVILSSISLEIEKPREEGKKAAKFVH